MTDRPNPARIVADADVLAADLLVDGDARRALDHVRSHTWVELVASDPLLDDAQAVIATLTDAELARDWRETVAELRVRVEHPTGDHPGLASAYRGNAAHLLTYDETLRSAKTGASINRRIPLSVRSPDAFARLFDPESLYESIEDEPYPGPDQDPRA